MADNQAFQFFGNSIKGVAIGAANVVPGLSGGTIALLCGVFERLIQSIKSIDLQAVRLLLRGRFREFALRIDFIFLLAIFSGLIVGNILLARLLEFLLDHYRVYTWAFFFGLVLTSVYFVAKRISRRTFPELVALLLGGAIAIGVSALPIADANSAVWYLLFCGVIAICSMMLPGLSGSYVLILLGNYRLIMLEGVGGLRFDILAPFLIGTVLGLLAFSRVLDCLLKKYHSLTIALLCGFIFGSLRSLWPWKEEIFQSFGEKQKVVGYQYALPEWNSSLIPALLLLLLGAASIVLTEVRAGKRARKEAGTAGKSA
ncbi:DUF368 domain-containing protein [Candidatus Haliotispira prima]|uniref:DUF368 domain-containing protein n=1 Tax=Candidatus Haliotispira prima TaxID=3034016 RepID=A0ABY8MJC6_9SPIO|nr:DUF368 domain-containing protein [Candidatus Haliotispira prima]